MTCYRPILTEGPLEYRELVRPPMRHYEAREAGCWVGGLSVRDDGEVLSVVVQYGRRRRGIATRLYQLACERGYTRPPTGATEQGQLWAESLRRRAA